MNIENDSPSLPPAGLMRRLGAILYDTLLLLALLFIATALLLPLTGGQAISRNPLYSTYLFFICFMFYGWFWTHGGQTLGMRAWKIRIQQRDGTGISWWQALLRFLVAIVSWLALGLGFLWMLADRDKMTWYDRYSETVLVLLKPPKPS